MKPAQREQQRGAPDPGQSEILVGAESDPLEEEAGRVRRRYRRAGAPVRLRCRGPVMRRVADPIGIAVEEV